jgi:hypothetical protein
MIPGDEGKPMSILERISDEPRDVEPYIEYLICNLEAYRDASWSTPEPWHHADEPPTTQEYVRHQINSHMHSLRNILSKLRRERSEAVLAPSRLQIDAVPEDSHLPSLPTRTGSCVRLNTRTRELAIEQPNGGDASWEVLPDGYVLIVSVPDGGATSRATDGSDTNKPVNIVVDGLMYHGGGLRPHPVGETCSACER